MTHPSKWVLIKGGKKILRRTDGQEFFHINFRLKRKQDVVSALNRRERFDPKTGFELFGGDPLEPWENGDVILHAEDYS